MVQYWGRLKECDNMKVFRDDKVYVQIKDLSILFKSGGVLIPQSVFKKALKKALDMTDETKEQFIMFDTPEEINLFKNVDYIVDFNDVIDMTDEEYKACLLSSINKADIIKANAKKTSGYFKLLGLNDQYKKELHKIKGVKEARYTKKKKLESKINGHTKKRCYSSFWKWLYRRICIGPRIVVYQPPLWLFVYSS